MPRPNRTWFGRGEEAEGPQAPSPLRSASVSVWIDELPIAAYDTIRIRELDQLRGQFAAMASQGEAARWIRTDAFIPTYPSIFDPKPWSASSAQPDPPDTGEPLGKASEKIRGIFDGAIREATQGEHMSEEDIAHILEGAYTGRQLEESGLVARLSGDFCSCQERQITENLEMHGAAGAGGSVFAIIKRERLEEIGYNEYLSDGIDTYIYRYIKMDRFFECNTVGVYASPNNGMIVKVASKILGLPEQVLYEDAYSRFGCIVTGGGWWEVEPNSPTAQPRKALLYLMRRCLEAVSRDFNPSGAELPSRLNGIYML